MLGYSIPLEEVPVATENIATDYDDSVASKVEFSLSNGNKLILLFPEQNVCILKCYCQDRDITSAADFKKSYPVKINFVPVLGPVEHNEELYLEATAKSALLSHRASRNFRNIWHHFPDGFDKFQEMIELTWPGMEISMPEREFGDGKPKLFMFCKEKRITREIFWVGFGFQVWCQMLTYIIKAGKTSLLLIDEPDIYLHSDLQRQLIAILRDLEVPILIATHSIEMIMEADPTELVIIDKHAKHACRIKNENQLRTVFQDIGSNFNPILTTIAKAKRVIFLEGNDFTIMAQFSRILGKQQLANQSSYAILPLVGLEPAKINEYAKGIEDSLGSKILKVVILDRNFRSQEECDALTTHLGSQVDLVHILQRTEIDNYVLDVDVFERAISKKMKENRSDSPDIPSLEQLEVLVDESIESTKTIVLHQMEGKYKDYLKASDHISNQSVAIETFRKKFEQDWTDPEKRIEMVSGKQILSILNKKLQKAFRISLTQNEVIRNIKVDNISDEIRMLIQKLSDSISIA